MLVHSDCLGFFLIGGMGGMPGGMGGMPSGMGGMPGGMGGMPGGMGGMPGGGGMPDLGAMFNDPEIMAAFQVYMYFDKSA